MFDITFNTISNALYFISLAFFINSILIYLSIYCIELYNRFEIRHIISLIVSYNILNDFFVNSFLFFKILMYFYFAILIVFFIFMGFKLMIYGRE